MSEQLRILLVAHGFPPESVGGVEQHVEGLAAALAARGHEVSVWCKSAGAGRPQGTASEDAPGRWPFKVTRVAYRHEGLTDLRSLYAVPLLDASLRSFLEGQRFDVAHVHHLTGVSTGILPVLRERGIATVLTLHDYWLICPRGQMWHVRGEACERVEAKRCSECLQASFGRWLPGAFGEAPVQALHEEALALLRSVDRLVVPSARALPPFASLGLDPACVRVVENGVDTRALARLAPPAPRRDVLQIGYLGTLIPSKGLDVLVDAFLRLPAGQAELHVHGNAVPYHGDDGFLTRVFSKLVPGSGCTYHGPYTGADLPRILGELDVVVAPALWREAFGLTVREALAAGRPIVVSAIGGLQDAVRDGEGGFVVPPGDREELAKALGKLAADRGLLLRMGQMAHGQARGFAAMAAELVSLYREASLSLR